MMLAKSYSKFFLWVNLVSYNSWVGPLPRIKTSFLLATYTDELMSATDTITFLPNPLQPDNKKLPRGSNPTLYLEYLHLSKSAFLVILAALK